MISTIRILEIPTIECLYSYLGECPNGLLSRGFTSNAIIRPTRLSRNKIYCEARIQPDYVNNELQYSRRNIAFEARRLYGSI